MVAFLAIAASVVTAFKGTVDAEVDSPGVWHATFGQDRAIANLFAQEPGGYFVDVGAAEPSAASNTRTLERDLGWRGLCIEADAYAHLLSSSHAVL